MRTTLKELAASGDLASRGAAALIKAGYADSAPLKELTPAVSHARSPRRSRASSRRCTSSSGRSTKARSSRPRPATASRSWSMGCAHGGRGGDGSSGRGRVSAFVAEFDSARETGAPFDKIRPSSALGDDQEAVAAFNNVLDVWEFVTRQDRETVCRPVDLGELVKRNLDPHRA